MKVSQFTTKFGKQENIRDFVERVLKAVRINPAGMVFKISSQVVTPGCVWNKVELPIDLGLRQFASALVHEAKHADLNLNDTDWVESNIREEIEKRVNAFERKNLGKIRSALTDGEKKYWDIDTREIEEMSKLLRSRKALLRKIKLARSTRIRKANAAIQGVPTDSFELDDLVRVISLGDRETTGIVVNVDVKAMKIWVRVHQSLRSRNHPIQFDPEELLLVWRGKKTIDTPVDGYPDMTDIEEQV